MRGPRTGIFCVEGEWSPSMRDKSSVRPLLELLRDREGIDFFYRDCGTPEELAFYPLPTVVSEPLGNQL